MATSEWEIPPDLQPSPADHSFDLDEALRSVVAVKCMTPPDAFTAETLGTERAGHGVQIRDSGVILTIGYLIVEAENVWIRTRGDRVVQGHALAYDTESGFGLVQALGATGAPSCPIGRSDEVSAGDRVVTAAAGGCEAVVAAACATMAGW